jgi:6-phosphogluconate dehydrogenase
MIIIITGVSGSGKTTIGNFLSGILNIPFFDADDFHSSENIEKMRAGIPLNDEDRNPWLHLLANKIKEWETDKGGILACSALKDDYRKILNVSPNIHWIHLMVDMDTVKERMLQRKGHYMNPSLIESQFEIWERPGTGIFIDGKLQVSKIIESLLLSLNLAPERSKLGIIGLGVMGKNLALNFAEQGVSVSVYNRFIPNEEEFIASSFAKANEDFAALKGYDDWPTFIASLEKPKKILLMVPAGKAVDEMIDQLIPLLQTGDVIIDGGNSFFEDSNRRHEKLEDLGLKYVSMGISGGEEGARKGPSLMPSGAKEALTLINPLLEKIAAKNPKGEPCVVDAGAQGAGHFIKMIHNSIEYAEMQVIAEIYQLMRFGLKFKPEEISKIFQAWMKEGLKSYLLEITAEILLAKNKEGYVVDQIWDVAAQKGTGSWSIHTSLKYQYPASPLSEAVFSRNISSLKEERENLSKLFNHNFKAFAEDKNLLLDKFKNAYQLTRIINHEIGFSIITKVYQQENWKIQLSAIANAWTNGCIIRSELMENLVEIFKETNQMFNHPNIIGAVKKMRTDLNSTIGMALQHDFSIPVMSSAANYLVGKMTKNSSANLIQAQRDYFGAHTYQLMNNPLGLAQHTDWKSLNKNNSPKK